MIDQLESRVLLSTGGMPDPGFGQGGYLKGYQVLAVLQDGSLIAQQDTPSGHALVQLHPDGSFEANYTGPTATAPPPNMQADGKYLDIHGNSWVSGNTVIRHNPDGSIDTTFGNNGSVSDFTSGTGYPAGSFNPEDVTVVGNHILVGGPLNLGGEQQPSVMALVQLNLDGSIDHSFGSSGIAKGTDEATDDVKTYQMLVGPNGNYFQSGEVFGFPSLIEFTPAGGFVSSTELQNMGEDHVYGLGFSRNTVYMLADWTSTEEGLAAYDLNLHPDTGFGNNGLVAVIPPDHSPSQMPEPPVSGPMIVDPDGRIFVSASFDYLPPASPGGDYAIAYLPDWGANTSVSGFIYNDANGNGKMDTGETPLRYWQAFVDLNGNGVFDKYEPTAYADYNGYYKIHALDPGTYKVYEVQPAGWTRTQPSPLPYYSFTVTTGAVATGNDFGNRQVSTNQPGSISGTFFYDGNHNGVWDTGEAPSPSWGVYIDANNDGKFDSGDTEIIANAHGQYTFANLAPGTYVIRGTTASGWTQTFPANGGAQVVTVGSGQNVTGVNFGEFHGIVGSGSISGTFFYDGNANGVWDPGEAPSPSWGVYIDANDDGIYDNGDKEIIANAHGQYTFSNLSAGTYVIRATTASGWKQTYPANGGAQVISLAAGQNATGINFGKVRT